TAVLLVNGYSGLGLHSLFNIFRIFGDTFKNYVFLQIGIIDAGVFKGVQELEELENKMQTDIEKYKQILNSRGYYAESFSTTGLDVVESLDRLLPQITEKFPHSIFFGGQIVFKEEKLFSRWLHNHTVFAVQRKLYHEGIQFMILPIRVDN
ncbi:MAG: amino acid transporter, partial [Bacteroidota bacterium]